MKNHIDCGDLDVVYDLFDHAARVKICHARGVLDIRDSFEFILADIEALSRALEVVAQEIRARTAQEKARQVEWLSEDEAEKLAQDHAAMVARERLK